MMITMHEKSGKSIVLISNYSFSRFSRELEKRNCDVLDLGSIIGIGNAHSDFEDMSRHGALESSLVESLASVTRRPIAFRISEFDDQGFPRWAICPAGGSRRIFRGPWRCRYLGQPGPHNGTDVPTIMLHAVAHDQGTGELRIFSFE